MLDFPQRRFKITGATFLFGKWVRAVARPTIPNPPTQVFPLSERGKIAGTFSHSRHHFIKSPLFYLPSTAPHLRDSSAVPHLRKMGRKGKSRASRDAGEVDQEEIAGGGASNGGGEGTSSDEKSLYEILGVDRTASQQEIKKAYHKLALRLHPDKNPDDEEAKEKFQLLQKVISILGDEEKRALYDQTGCTDDDALVGESAESLKEFFRAMFKKVTEADIEEFEASYRGSDSEKKDLKDLYKKYKGNMDRLFCSMICSEPKLDSHRFKDIIDEAIAEGELKSTKAYQKWAKQVSEITAPTDPLVKRGKKKKEPGADLVTLISERQGQRKQHFDSLFSSILSKHAGGASSEPTEEEFEKARQRLEGKKLKKCKK